MPQAAPPPLPARRALPRADQPDRYRRYHESAGVQQHGQGRTQRLHEAAPNRGGRELDHLGAGFHAAVPFDQAGAADKGRQVRVIRDLEAHAQHPAERGNDEDLFEGETAENRRNGYRRKKQGAAEI